MSERFISEIADINPPLTRVPKGTDLVSFVSMSDVNESGGIRSSVPRPFGAVNNGFTRFQENDTLFAKITPCMENGKGALARDLVGGVGCGSTEFHVLRPKSGHKADYLYQLMQWQSTRQTAELFMSGSAGQQRVQSTFFHKHRVYAPSQTAQERIATILSTIDTAIEQTEALIEKYQHIKAGLMHDLFTRGVLPTGQLRPPREQAPELYQETAIGWIPREWRVAGLAAMGRAGASWIRTGPFGSSLKGEHWRIDGHPVITIGALGTGEFIDSELLFVGSKDASRLVDFQLKENDVVFSRVADVGRSVVLREAQGGWIMSSNLMRIAVNDAVLRPDYLQMQLAGDWRVKAQIRASVNSGGRDVANSEVLNRLRFAVPAPDEQDRIIAIANHQSNRMNSERRKVAKLQTQKLGLMQDLLTGKVAVNVTSPETETT